MKTLVAAAALATSTMSVMSVMSVMSMTGCGNDFDPGSRVTSLRVLAVHADAPYARPGETVHLDALAFDPEARAIAWGWSYCVDPAGATPMDCLASVAAPPVVEPVVEGDATYTLTVPTDALSRLPDGARADAMIGVVVVACPGTLSLGAQANVQCIDASGRSLDLHDFIVGMKRIYVRDADRNANPTIARVTWDGVDWPESEVKDVAAGSLGGNVYDDADGEKHTIAAVPSDDSAESGTDEFGTPFHEEIVVQYYATEGIFEHDTRVGDSPATGWVARGEAKGSTVRLWLVVRDDRGGVTWAQRSVRVR